MNTDKVDPYHHRERWEAWRRRNCKGIKRIQKENSDLILSFLFDMELGRNVSPTSKKGARSHIRLNSLKCKMLFLARHFNKPLSDMTEDEVMRFFYDLRSGKIRRPDGETYIGVSDIVKDFKTFWNWLLRTNRTKKNIITYLSRSDGIKPAWVYLTEKQFYEVLKKVDSHIAPLILFMYDSGMRVTEANSIRVRDFSDDFQKLNISQEISKTFGRKITLSFSIEAIKKFVKQQNLTSNDRLFIVCPAALNKQLRKAARAVFGNALSPAREEYRKLTLYDLRHNAACYWAQRYPTMRGLMYRFGWKREEQASYYHEFLGFRDEIHPLVKKEAMQDLSEKITLLLSLLKSKNISIPTIQN